MNRAVAVTICHLQPEYFYDWPKSSASLSGLSPKIAQFWIEKEYSPSGVRITLMSHLKPADILKELSPMRRYARSLTRDENAADDVVQDALIKALEKRDSFRPDGSRRGWLLAIVHNTFISLRRRERAETSRNARFAETMIDHLEPDQEHSAYLSEVARAFAALPEHQRTILHLVAIEGQSYQEAAIILNIPIGTVMSRVSRARTALRNTHEEGKNSHRELKIIGGRYAD